MQPVDKLSLAGGLLCSLFTLYGIILLIPRLGLRLWEWHARRRRNHGTIVMPSYPQRVVFLLLTCLLTTVDFAAAFHRRLDELTGLSSSTMLCLMLLLATLYLALDRLNKYQKRGKGPDEKTVCRNRAKND